MIPVCETKLGKKELEYVIDCIKTSWISSKGKYITEFEEKSPKSSVLWRVQTLLVT